MRKFSVSFLLMVSLLLAIAPARAVTSKLTISDLTTQSMTVNAYADNPFVEITVIDVKTKQVIGKSNTTTGKNGDFSSTVNFSPSLPASGELDMRIIDSASVNTSTESMYSIIFECYYPGPCNFKVIHSAGVGGDTMSPGH